MKCGIKGCENDLPEKPQEFNVIDETFQTRKVKVCDKCREKHTKPGTPLYIPLKEGV